MKHRYGARYVSGLLIFVAATLYATMMSRRYVVPYAYGRYNDCHYDGSLSWMLGEDYDPTKILNACHASAHRGAEFVGWLSVIFVVFAATALLALLSDLFVRQAWGEKSRKYGRVRRGLDKIRTWCGIAAILLGTWVVWLLWPLF